jgi:hypothetical protein
MTDVHAIRAFLERVRDEIVDEQIQKDLFASGKSASSLQVVATETGGQLVGDDSFIYQTDKVGRRPGTMPPIKAIEEWIEVKMLSFLNPWAVAKSIAKKGTSIFRGERKGIDIDKILETNREILIKDLADASKFEVQNAIKEAINKPRK